MDRADSFTGGRRRLAIRGPSVELLGNILASRILIFTSKTEMGVVPLFYTCRIRRPEPLHRLTRWSAEVIDRSYWMNMVVGAITYDPCWRQHIFVYEVEYRYKHTHPQDHR
jgi:hypothetical protein